MLHVQILHSAGADQDLLYERGIFGRSLEACARSTKLGKVGRYQSMHFPDERGRQSFLRHGWAAFQSIPMASSRL